MNSKSNAIQLDYRVILSFIEPNSAVLDLGCGDGELLSLLIREKKVRGQGIEIDEQAIYKCVARGLSVFHGDLARGLSEYAGGSFDYVILNQTFQQVVKLDFVLDESLRVGRKVIVGFPNFALYTARLQLFFRGRTPVTPSLPYKWYDTPNLHFLTILDFIDYCRERRVTIEKAVYLGEKREVKFLPNLFAGTGLFMISK
ncbi:MAG: methionine biosynthesis protein MetW [Armatimonadetes bacterium]|nr:methionine biosynthesis protein MetW [Armatimonadota bacterium]